MELFYPFSETDKSTYEFADGGNANNDVGAPGYSYYERFLLKDLPVIGPTQLPLITFLDLPSWHISGSLLYLFLK
jgi:hypothetical protein